MAASFLKESERATSDCLFQFLDSSGDGRISYEDLWAAVYCCVLLLSSDFWAGLRVGDKSNRCLLNPCDGGL